MLKNLLDKLLNRKTVDLDNDGKIETLRGEVIGVFSQFKRMHQKLDEVNVKLTEVMEEEKRLADLAQKRIDKVQAELQANTKLQEKVKEFIVE